MRCVASPYSRTNDAMRSVAILRTNYDIQRQSRLNSRLTCGGRAAGIVASHPAADPLRLTSNAGGAQ